MFEVISSYSFLPAVEILLIVCAYFLVVLFSLTIHEFAHAFAAYKFGDDTAKLAGRLTLNPFKHLDLWGSVCLLLVGFGWAKPVPINPLKFRQYKKGMFWVSSAGIITNFVLGIIFSVAAYLLQFVCAHNYFLLFLYFFFAFGCSLNFALAIFNLLPLYPLDGFNMISAYAKYDNKFVNFMHKYGQLIMLILIISSAFSYILTYSVGYLTLGLDKLWGIIFGM